MSIAVLIFCVLPMASRGNLYAQSPNGALQASGKTSVTSHDGNITINLNLNIALQKIKGKRPAGTPTNAPSGSMTTASPSLSPSASTPIPTGAPPPPPGPPPPPPTGAPPPPPGPPPPPPTGAPPVLTGAPPAPMGAAPVLTGAPPVLTGAPPAPMGAAPGSPGPDPAGPPAGTPGATFAEEGLQAHNYYRSFHDSPPMTLNEQMNNQATAYANKLAQDGFLMHSPKTGEREGQGENLYMGCSSRPGDTAGSVAVKAWYDEVCSPGYPFGSVQSTGGAGHFTQVVWSDSTELGYGKATVDRRGMKCTYVVARYKPLGNFFTGQDDYNKNVKKGSNFDKDNYCRGRKRKRNQFHTKSVFPAERVMLGLPEQSTHEHGVLRKGKISQRIANTGFTAYQ